MVRVRDLVPDDAVELTALYGEYGWWADREVEGVRRALANTDVAVGIEAGEDGDLVAAARVLTDRTYYANVFDVVVAAERRGEGLGARLLEAVVDHPDLRSVVGVSLLCRQGLVPFYGSVGFERHDGEVELPEGGTGDLVRMTYRTGR